MSDNGVNRGETAGEYATSDAFGMVRSYTRHLMFVRLALKAVEQELERRALVHDASKMLDDEFAGFCRINAAARVNKFGSPEYADGMKRERPTIDLHFRRNSHHPEEHDQSFLDVIEMVCDWWGARKGYDDSRSWLDSVALNLKQKGAYLTSEQSWLARQVAAFLAKALPESPVVSGPVDQHQGYHSKGEQG